MDKEKWESLHLAKAPKGVTQKEGEHFIADTFKNLAEKYSQNIYEQTFKDNQKALEIFAQQGKKFVLLDVKEKQKIKRLARKVGLDLLNVLYSKDEFETMMTYRSEYRKLQLDNLQEQKEKLEQGLKKSKSDRAASMDRIKELSQKIEMAQTLFSDSEEQIKELQQKFSEKPEK